MNIKITCNGGTVAVDSEGGKVVTVAGSTVISTGGRGMPGAGASPSGTVEALDGTGEAGTSGTYSQGDHKHAVTPAGIGADPAGSAATAEANAKAASDPAGTASAAVSAHDGAADPHHGKFDASGAAAAVAGDLTTHTGLTTTAHGGIVASTDSRLFDARTPTAHNQGADTITTGTLDGDRLPAMSDTKAGAVPATGTPSGKVLSDGGTWVAQTGGGGSGDVVGPSSAVDLHIPMFDGTTGKKIKDSGVSVYGLGTPTVTGMATVSQAADTNTVRADDLINFMSFASGLWSKITWTNFKALFGGAAWLSVGTTTGTVAAGDDSRLSDARTPTAHTHVQADSHGTPDTDAATTSLHHTLGTGANQAMPGNTSIPAATGAAIHAASAASIVDADEVGFWQITGSVLAKITWANIKAALFTYFSALFHREHGFENRTSSTLVWTDSSPARTLTITGTFSYFYQGTKITIANTSPAVQIDNTAGIWYIYFASNGTLTASQNFPAFATSVIVAIVAWNGTSGTVYDERHNSTRNLVWHGWAHSSIGCRYGSGIDLTTTGTGATATFATTSGDIWDEDINFTVPASSAWTAAHAVRIWRQTSASAYTFNTALSTTPFLWNSGTSRVQFVQSDHATPYSLVDCATNRFVNVWVYAANNINQPIKMLVETKAGATGYTSVAAARAVSPPNLKNLGLAPEMKIMYRLVVQGDGIVQAAVTADDYRNASPLPAGGSASTSAAAVSYSSSAVLASATNVQAALDLIGTAGVATTGTGAGQVVVLDGSAKLPAVDGSQLTNLPAASVTKTAVDATNHQITSHTWAGANKTIANLCAFPLDAYDKYLWHFDDNVTDAITGIATTAYNSPTYTEVTGWGKVLTVNGSNQYLRVTTPQSIGSGAWAISFRLKLATVRQQWIFSYGDDVNGNAQCQLAMYADGHFDLGCNDTADVNPHWASTSAGLAQTSDWSTFLIIGTGTSAALYIDSVKRAEIASLSGVYVAGSDLWIGRRGEPTYPNYLSGQIDELKIRIGASQAATVPTVPYNLTTPTEVDATTAGLAMLAAADASAQMAIVGAARTLTCTSPLTIGGGSSATLAADRTLAIPAATASVPGHATAAQIAKLDSLAAVNYQEFTSDGTWTKPAGVTMVLVEAIGGGGAGSAGRWNNNATASGGTGGATGCVVVRQLLASACGATETIVVGQGAPGPAASATVNTNGVTATAGTNSKFGSIFSAPGGKSAPSGTTGAQVVASSFSRLIQNSGSNSEVAGIRGLHCPGSGAGGGGGAASPVDGLAGGGIPLQDDVTWDADTTILGGGGAAGTSGGAGGNGAAWCGGGGGGGVVGAGQKTGGAGGNGGVPGGGGGGGGGADTTDNNTASRGGAGGSGGNGRVRVWSW